MATLLADGPDRGVPALVRAIPIYRGGMPDGVLTHQVAGDGPGFPGRAAEKLAALLDGELADLRRAGREAAENRWDWRHQAEETVRVLENNLREIDRAIDQCRAALAADPASVYLNSHLANAQRRKLALLRRAAALVSERS